MSKLKIALYALGCIFLLNACYSEDEIVPSEKKMVLRFEFPQGNNSWDEDIISINDNFGVCLIYTDLEESDFNRAWTGAAGGLASMQGQGLNDEQAEFYTNFMKDHVFAYLYPELTKKVFPPYYYMAYDYHAAFKLSPEMIMKTDLTFGTDGLDFWVTCLEGEPNLLLGGQTKRPETAEEFLLNRGEILYEVFKRAVDVGNIVVPDNFNDGIDYKTEVENRPGYEDEDNYYLKRGFPGTMASKFTSFSKLSDITSMTPAGNFVQYICLGMRYTKAECEEVFPSSKYPLIHEKRQLVMEYMKEKYNVDLAEINKGPEL